MKRTRIKDNSAKELGIFFGTLCSAVIMLLVLMWVAPIPANAEELELDTDWYLEYAWDLGLPKDFCDRAGVGYYDCVFREPDTLSTEYLTTRDQPGRGIVVECFIGLCIGNEDGIILNTSKKQYNYISYRDLDICEGDIVATYCLYDPNGNGEDDIVWREDYVIDTDQIIEE